MKTIISDFINFIFKPINLRLIKLTTYNNLISWHTGYSYYKILSFFDFNISNSYIKYSKSQLLQDVFVANYTGKKNGFFVEIGATNGVDLSNTHLLEYHLNWKGILVEPARIWHKDLSLNRNVIIDTKALYSSSGERLEFIESTIPTLSGLKKFLKSSPKNKSYYIETISLGDLLKLYDAPRLIDYLSIDTEGSEYEILKVFNFNEYQFNVITIEHNYSLNRNKILDLMISNGYLHVLNEISDYEFWFIKKDFLTQENI